MSSLVRCRSALEVNRKVFMMQQETAITKKAALFKASVFLLMHAYLKFHVRTREALTFPLLPGAEKVAD